MVRTTANAVGKITEVDPTIDLTPFIEVANALVTEICAPVATYDDVRLELIERWLSAHFYRVRDARLDCEKIGDIYTRITGKTGLALDLTYEGQQVKFIDTSGKLALLDQMAKTGKRLRIQVAWLGSLHLPHHSWD